MADQNQNTAVIEVEENRTKPAPRPREQTKVKQMPPYVVILENDDVHSFEYVIQSLQKVFKYDATKATHMTMMAHLFGRTAIWSGSLEVAELKREQLRSCGPDIFASKGPVNFPLRCHVEKLP